MCGRYSFSLNREEAVLERRPVSSRVNRVSENDSELLKAVKEETIPEQQELFGD